LHGAGSLSELVNSAKYADTLYNYTFNATKPITGDVEVCYSNDVTLTAEGASKFNWYREKTGGSPVSSASELIIPDLLEDTILYVSNAENSYESLRSSVSVMVRPNPTVVVSAEKEFCEGGSVILTATEGEKYTWNTGTETRDLKVTSSGSYTVAVDNGSIECTSLPVEIIVHPLPTASFTVSAEDEGDGYLARLLNESTGATTWLWNFGDGNSSVEKNPNHLYETKDDYTITLTSTSAQGCEASESRPLGPVTATEVSLERNVKLYPNPVTDDQLVISYSGVAEALELEILNSHGRLIHHTILGPNGVERVLNFSGLATGVYLIRIKSPQETVVKKIVVSW
jgi:PKD repeat protein